MWLFSGHPCASTTLWISASSWLSVRQMLVSNSEQSPTGKSVESMTEPANVEV